ncbi:MAG: ABC transporter substrate-binding protein [Anaerolineae bacterium]
MIKKSDQPWRILALLTCLLLSSCAPAPADDATTADESTTEASAGLGDEAETPEADTTAADDATASGSGILRIRVAGDLTDADPAFHPAGPDTLTVETVGEGLIAYKPGSWEWEKVLAESIEPSADGLRIAFTLRQGVQFHGGYGELTAEDVKFSYERYLDPDLKSTYAGDWEALDHVEVTGTYSGAIVLKKPFAPLWTSTLPVTGGVIVSRKALADMGRDAYKTHPIGTGPYAFDRWESNQRIVMKRFADYWGAKPAWDEIHLVIIPEDSAAEVALEAGDLDFSGVDAKAAERLASKGLTTNEIKTLNYAGIFMNVTHLQLKDKRVRQAIRLATDVDGIIAAAYEGKAVRACAVIGEGQLGYWSEAPCYDRDLVGAKALLAEAKATDLRLAITVLDREDEKATAEILQADLKAIGIAATVEVVDDGGYWDLARYKERALTVFNWGTTNPDPHWQMTWFSCKQVGEYNWMQWCDPAFDAVNSKATELSDDAERAALYVEAQKLWDRDVNVVWTIHPISSYAAQAGIIAAQSPNGLALPQHFRRK